MRRNGRRQAGRTTRTVVGGLRAGAAVFVAVGAWSLYMAASAPSAFASTVDGTATVAAPTTLDEITGIQPSTTAFTVTLPANTACSGATSGSTPDGYHVESYLIASDGSPGDDNTAIEAIIFTAHPSPPSYGIPSATGAFWENQSTAVTTGDIIGIPNNFEWGSLVGVDKISLSTLLFSGSGSSASGVWEAGIACANSSGVLSDFWNTEVTFTASTADTNGFQWSAVPGPPGSTTSSTTSTTGTSPTTSTTGTSPTTSTTSPTSTTSTTSPTSTTSTTGPSSTTSTTTSGGSTTTTVAGSTASSGSSGSSTGDGSSTAAVGATTPASSGSLAFTGSPVVRDLALGLLCIGFGLILLGLSAKCRQAVLWQGVALR